MLIFHQSKSLTIFLVYCGLLYNQERRHLVDIRRTAGLKHFSLASLFR